MLRLRSAHAWAGEFGLTSRAVRNHNADQFDTLKMRFETGIARIACWTPCMRVEYMRFVVGRVS